MWLHLAAYNKLTIRRRTQYLYTTQSNDEFDARIRQLLVTTVRVRPTGGIFLPSYLNVNLFETGNALT